MLDYTEGVDPNYAHVIKFDEQKPAADFEQFGDKRRSIDIKGSVRLPPRYSRLPNGYGIEYGSRTVEDSWSERNLRVSLMCR
jgi:hypothetical protein